MDKMNFFEALAIAGEKRKIRYKEESWSYYGQKISRAVLLDQNSVAWWPTIEQQREKEWEVEPKEIVVLACCDSDGSCNLIVKDDSTALWRHDDGIWNWEGEPLNLFPQDKSQKYKLVPISD